VIKYQVYEYLIDTLVFTRMATQVKDFLLMLYSAIENKSAINKIQLVRQHN
jgi:hypothetical protein